MREYETTIIIQPEISDEGTRAIFERLDSVIESESAVRLMCEDQGKRKLAYEVRKFQKGHYYILSYLDSGTAVPSLERLLRMDESVLRFLTVQVSDEVADTEARRGEAREQELAQQKRAEERAAREAEEAEARAAAELADAERRAEASAEAAARAEASAAASTDVDADAGAAAEAAPVTEDVKEDNAGDSEAAAAGSEAEEVETPDAAEGEQAKSEGASS